MENIEPRIREFYSLDDDHIFVGYNDECDEVYVPAEDWYEEYGRVLANWDKYNLDPEDAGLMNGPASETCNILLERSKR